MHRDSLFAKPKAFPSALTANAAQPFFCTELLRPQFMELNLKTFTSVEWEADNKTRASRGLNPHVTAVVENSLAGER
jgi:hypothetical protein